MSNNDEKEEGEIENPHLEEGELPAEAERQWTGPIPRPGFFNPAAANYHRRARPLPPINDVYGHVPAPSRLYTYRAQPAPPPPPRMTQYSYRTPLMPRPNMSHVTPQMAYKLLVEMGITDPFEMIQNKRQASGAPPEAVSPQAVDMDVDTDDLEQEKITAEVKRKQEELMKIEQEKLRAEEAEREAERQRKEQETLALLRASLRRPKQQPAGKKAKPEPKPASTSPANGEAQPPPAKPVPFKSKLRSAVSAKTVDVGTDPPTPVARTQVQGVRFEHEPFLVYPESSESDSDAEESDGRSEAEDAANGKGLKKESHLTQLALLKRQLLAKMEAKKRASKRAANNKPPANTKAVKRQKRSPSASSSTSPLPPAAASKPVESGPKRHLERMQEQLQKKIVEKLSTRVHLKQTQTKKLQLEVQTLKRKLESMQTMLERLEKEQSSLNAELKVERQKLAVIQGGVTDQEPPGDSQTTAIEINL